VIQVQSLRKRFGDQEVLRGVDVTLRRGAITGLVGPNGAGKTTLIKVLLGLVRPDAGILTFDGRRILPNDVDYRSRIGYMPQIPRYPETLTGRELMSLLQGIRGGSAPIDETLVRRFGLEPELDKRLRVLSGGTRQKVNAAMAFRFGPELLILDEPTAGLDPVAATILKDQMTEAAAQGRTVLVTSHIMSEVEQVCDDLLFLLDGAVRFSGPIDELRHRTHQDTLERAIASLMIREVA
jgi:Cu-processing system ATP-binding protein